MWKFSFSSMILLVCVLELTSALKIGIAGERNFVQMVFFFFNREFLVSEHEGYKKYPDEI